MGRPLRRRLSAHPAGHVAKPVDAPDRLQAEIGELQNCHWCRTHRKRSPQKKHRDRREFATPESSTARRPDDLTLATGLKVA
jgi:hypothetical protein